MIVIDTNVIAGLWVPNDMDELAYEVLEKDPDWIAPLLWRSEFRNVLATYLCANILIFSIVLHAIEEMKQLMDSKEFEINSTQVLSLLLESSCSSYDCEFVTLADDLDRKLVSFDKKINKAFPGIALHPRQFIAQS